MTHPQLRLVQGVALLNLGRGKEGQQRAAASLAQTRTVVSFMQSRTKLVQTQVRNVQADVMDSYSRTAHQSVRSIAGPRDPMRRVVLCVEAQPSPNQKCHQRQLAFNRVCCEYRGRYGAPASASAARANCAGDMLATMLLGHPSVA